MRFSHNSLWACLILVFAAGLALAKPPGQPLPLNQLTETEKDQGWRLLFNGKDLEGWEHHRKISDKPTKWEVVDGVLRGTEHYGLLIYPETFTDFVLSMDVRVTDTGQRRGNSGVFFRCREDPTVKRGLVGYEAQVDHGSIPNPTGSIYNLFKAAETNVKDGQWFHMTIWAVGDRLTTWVNERPVVDARDTKQSYRSGFIVLQMHHASSPVEFRNIKIRPLKTGDAALGPPESSPLEPGFTRIFDGKTLAGWHTNPEPVGDGTGGLWRVIDGAIVAQQDPPGSGNGGILLTDAKYRDFEFLIETNTDYGIDSGIFLRCTDQENCYQVLLDYRHGGNVGGLYLSGVGGFRDAFLMPHNQFGRYYRHNHWNLIRARIVGQPPLLDVWLNGSHVTHWQDTESRLPPENPIALQVHGAKSWTEGKLVRFRNIRIKPLP